MSPIREFGDMFVQHQLNTGSGDGVNPGGDGGVERPWRVSCFDKSSGAKKFRDGRNFLPRPENGGFRRAGVRLAPIELVRADPVTRELVGRSTRARAAAQRPLQGSSTGVAGQFHATKPLQMGRHDLQVAGLIERVERQPQAEAVR